MRILIISNTDIEEVNEDFIIAKSFEEDGCFVKIVNVDYDEALDDCYDVFIKRNAYYEDEELDLLVDKLSERLKLKNKILINFNGKYDSNGKKYLARLYEKGLSVIPSIDNIANLDKLPETNEYVLKKEDGYDGIGQQIITKEEIEKKFKPGFILQPKIEFEKEVQFYFVNKIFCYALEFYPSKVPVYPDAKKYEYTNEELCLAQRFANLNSNFIGIQRLDFLKRLDGELLLIEIEDSSPYLDLEELEKSDLDKFLKEYKNMIYTYIKKLDVKI